MTPLADRVVALRESRAPQNRTSPRCFLSMINYYHRFLPGIAPILAPLHAQASGKGQNIEWTKECQEAFDSAKFRSLHVYLVGPLPESQGMTYLFTIIDRLTRWPEAVPLPDAYASTCATALLHHLVARFGVPEDITSDWGRQFTVDPTKQSFRC
ncbi:Gag-Pol polyprotein [Plakobranchus ocellatus]|uniref:Gag-Pol polyprotein n=1 Tax=Plakobranchus ocellatus TaxID=259542 RepID=A0AAV4C5X7_9GAST|nr:Gag-Pol polyprotein [Plakobranchus ocellatus]